MELYEEIRREYEFGVGTIKGVARKLGVHRRMVREAVARFVKPGGHTRPGDRYAPQVRKPVRATGPERRHP